MVATLRIDTLKFARSLTDAGLSREAAEAIVQGVSEADVSELATKTDVSLAVADLRAEISSLRADIYNRLWVMGLGIVGLTVALMKILPG
jgi:hypothetical protein